MDDGPLETSPSAHIYRCTLHLVRPLYAMSCRHRILTFDSWGAAATCSGAVNNMPELIVCRCLLGIFEAAFGAGAPYFLSLFYRRQELGLRVSLLLGMSPLANCFASALAYAITHIKDDSLESWRYLFIIGSCIWAFE